MPTFTFTSPDGKKYDVQGPEGATKEQAFGILQQQLGAGSAQKQAAPTAPLDRLPPETSPGNRPSKNADGIANRILGFGEAGASAITGALGGAAGQLYGVGKALTGGKYGTQQGAQEAEAAGVGLANKLTYQPRTETGKQLTEGLGNALEGSRLQGFPVEGGALGQMGQIPRGVLGAGEGAAAAGRAVGKGAANVASKALPEVDAETAQLARQAHQMGMRLTPEQVIGGKYSRIAGEGLGSVPLSGSSAEANKSVWLSKLSESAGVAGPKPTPTAFGEATERVGKGIGDLNAKYDLPVDKPLISQLKAYGLKGQSPEIRSAVNYFVKRIQQNTKDGAVSGATFRKINTELNDRIKAASNGDTKYALTRLQDKLQTVQKSVMSPEDTRQLQNLRRQYAIQRAIEPLVAKAPTGDIDPSALLGAITNTKAGKARVARGGGGDLATLAAIGSKFLKPPKSSGTAERRLIQGIPPALASAAGAGAGVAGGAATLPAVLGGLGATYAAANLYNRASPAITRALIDKPPQ